MSSNLFITIKVVLYIQFVIWNLPNFGFLLNDSIYNPSLFVCVIKIDCGCLLWSQCHSVWLIITLGFDQFDDRQSEGYKYIKGFSPAVEVETIYSHAHLTGIVSCLLMIRLHPDTPSFVIIAALQQIQNDDASCNLKLLFYWALLPLQTVKPLAVGSLFS